MYRIAIFMQCYIQFLLNSKFVFFLETRVQTYTKFNTLLYCVILFRKDYGNIHNIWNVSGMILRLR